MTDGDGSVSLQQQAGNRSPYDLTAADDARVGAGNLDSIPIEQLNDSGRRTRHEARPAHRQQTDIRRMKRVDVLRRIDRLNDRGVVDLFWQRQLHEDSVDVLVPVQRSYC